MSYDETSTFTIKCFAMSPRRPRRSRRRAFAWVAATWVVINCDKAQTRRAYTHYTRLSYPRVRKRPCVSAHPHNKRVHIHAHMYVLNGLWIACVCARVGATTFSRGISTRERESSSSSAFALELPRCACNLELDGHACAAGPISGHTGARRKCRNGNCAADPRNSGCSTTPAGCIERDPLN